MANKTIQELREMLPDEVLNLKVNPVINIMDIKAKPRIRNKYRRLPEDVVPGSQNSGVSKTIPGETLTIRELLIKHTQGLEQQIQNEPIYVDDVTHESFDLSKIHNMDLAEKQEVLNMQIDLVDEIQRIVHEQQEAKKAQNESQNSESAAKGTKDEDKAE